MADPAFRQGGGGNYKNRLSIGCDVAHAYAGGGVFLDEKFLVCVCFKTQENASESVDCIYRIAEYSSLHIAPHKRLKSGGQTALVSKPRILHFLV